MDAMGAIVGCGGRAREVERKIASLLCASGFIYKMSHDPPPRPSTQHLLNPQPTAMATRRRGLFFGVLFCFLSCFLSRFLSLFSTFRSKVLMKGGGYVTGG
jgi:hypothetical protein